MTELDRLLGALPPRRVLVVSDRYPPDVGGGAERSLHLMLREPALRDRGLVVTFDKALDRPVRRDFDGVVVVALPAPAAWPLDRLTQFEVDRLKERPFGLKWPAFAVAALGGVGRAPGESLAGLALHLAARPEGGVAMDHVSVPESAMEAALARIVAHVRPELVHADNARAILVAAGALGDRPVPLVAAVRDHRFTSARFDQSSDDAPAAAGRFAARALAFRQRRLARADAVLAAGAGLAQALQAILPSGRLRRLPLTPVETKPAAPEPAEGFHVLVVGSLAPHKGQGHVLDLWPAVLAEVPGARLIFAGDGPSAKRLAHTTIARGLGASVEFHGAVDAAALDALYVRAHVVALPTLWREPFGRVPLEAGAAGRAVVAYAVGGHNETVADGVTGRLVTPGDGPGFVAALAALARDPALRRRFGDEGRRRAATYAPPLLAESLGGVWDLVRETRLHKS